MRKLLRPLLAGCAALLIASCSSMTPVADGSGTETTTGYTALAVYADGSRAVGAAVHLRPADYFKPVDTSDKCARCLDTVTDNTGRLKLAAIDSGNYVIEINDNEGWAVAVQCEIGLPDSMRDLGTWTLKPYARISGKLDAAPINGNRYVAVRGLDRLTLAGPDGAFSIYDMPEGLYELRVFSSSPADPQNVLDNIETFSGSAFAVHFPAQWKYSRLAFLKTTAGGAAVSGDVTGFPVLFRLSASNFDFSLAADSGRDLRFAKTDGTALPAEIERFSRAKSVAEIWVRADTVYGSDSGQAIVMSWGNPAASMSSSGPAVFGAANGFEAVWHLNAGCVDATGNGHDGTDFGASDAAGLIGGCKHFGGMDSLRVNGLLGSPAVVTLSAWVRSAAADTSGYEVLSLGGNVILRLDVKQSLFATGLYQVHCADSSATAWSLIQTAGSLPDQWHYLSFSLDAINHVQSVSLDGNAAAVHYDTSAVLYSGLGTNTFIGSGAVGAGVKNFVGEIDEARVCTVARSDDWNKLCYMNQKPVDALVSFK
ncbi:MAG TPA: DUF2341 domain-containing protein [Chitinivibrionales bacterium]|nr:DUF2341 domain-containing protein [Chitinivibrionales bacterium]